MQNIKKFNVLGRLRPASLQIQFLTNYSVINFNGLQSVFHVQF